jgi:hypothetical protein
MRRLNLTNQRFNECIVQSLNRINALGKSVWNCECDCGNTFIALGSELRSGHTRSCGCYSRSGTFNLKHGYRRMENGKQHPLYTLWVNTRERCHNPNHPKFEDYGGRGITVFPKWRESFELFIEDLFSVAGERPPNVAGYKRYWSIDRIDNDGNYEPGNIKWSTPFQQKANQRKRRWWKKPTEEGV